MGDNCDNYPVSDSFHPASPQQMILQTPQKSACWRPHGPLVCAKITQFTSQDHWALD